MVLKVAVAIYLAQEDHVKEEWSIIIDGSSSVLVWCQAGVDIHMLLGVGTGSKRAELLPLHHTVVYTAGTRSRIV